MRLKASPESHICLSCRHWVVDMDEAVFLEVDGPDGKSYGYFCPFCANQMMKDGHARLPNTSYVPLSTNTEATDGCPF